MIDYDLPDFDDVPERIRDFFDDGPFEQLREERAERESAREEAVAELKRLLRQKFDNSTLTYGTKTSCVKYAAVMGWEDLADEMRRDLR